MPSRKSLSCTDLQKLMSAVGLPSDNEIETEESGDDDPESENNVGLVPNRLDLEQGVSNFNSVDMESQSSESDEENRETIRLQERKRIWKKLPNGINSTLATFTNDEGPVYDLFATAGTPTEFFLTYLDEDIIGNVTYQTNLYAVQRNKTFLPISKEELLSFLMGYHTLPSWTHYWNCDSDLQVSLVAETMTRDRFGAILSNLHVNDNSKMPKDNKDKLYKLRPLIDQLNVNFKKLWRPSREQSVDESMIAFKGRSSLKQYNPMKPIKRGYKIWCRGEMSGYISQFEIYQGKSENGAAAQETFGLGGRVILDMTEDLKDQNYVVYADNYFSSLPLLERMKSDGILACMTIRCHRKGMPFNEEKMKSQQRKVAKMKKGEYENRTTGDITVYKWMDSKPVFFASNFHGTEMTSVERRQKDGSLLDVPCPKVVADYNDNMGGVDKADMLRSVYGLDRKSRKWWQRILWGLLDMTIVNAYVAYVNMPVTKKIPIFTFKRLVVKGLLTMGKKTIRKRGRPKEVNETSPTRVPQKRRKQSYSIPVDMRCSNLGAHWPVFASKRGGRCEVCSNSGGESRPFSKCTTCNVYLCCNSQKNCFVEYHKL